MSLMTEDDTTESYSLVSFDHLPVEILLPIVSSLESLDVLWNLMRASPRVWSLFDNHALEITEGILSGPDSILPDQIQQLVRAVIAIRCKIFPFRRIHEFRDLCTRIGAKVKPPKVYPGTLRRPGGLSEAPVTSAVLRSTVATASHMAALSQACLAASLERLRDPSFRPLHCTDPKPDYGSTHPHFWPEGHSKHSAVDPWDREYQGAPVQVIDVGQPSWVEDMRALRAMWTLQLIGETRNLLADLPDLPGWTDTYLLLLRDAPLHRLLGTRPGIPMELSELTSASDFLSSLGEPSNEQFHRLPKAPKPTATNRWTIAARKQASFMQYDGDAATRIYTEDYYFDQTLSAMKKYAPALVYIHRMSTRGNSPIRGVPFKAFLPFGFAFWDRRRTYHLGLTRRAWDGDEEFSDEFYMFAWESILDPAIVLKVKTELRNKSG